MKRTSYLNYYSRTAEALAVDSYAVAPAWESRRAEPKRPARRAGSRRNKIVYEPVYTNERFFSARMIFTLLLVFVGMIMSTMSFAATKKHQIEINSMVSELRGMQEEEALLRAEIAEKYDVTQIEKHAIMRLNMSKPKAYQMVHIDVPKQSYVVQYGIKTPEEPESFAEKVSGLVLSLGR